MNSWLIPLFGISLAAWAFLREGLRTSEEKVTNGNVDNRGICNSKECLQVANDFLNSMNESVDPCVDFYRFACENFETHNPFPGYGYLLDSVQRFIYLSSFRLRDELEKETSSDDILPVQQMKKFYELCRGMTQLEGVASVNAVLRGANDPMIMSSATRTRSSLKWQEVDRYYEELSGINAFFKLSIPDVRSEHATLQVVGKCGPVAELPRKTLRKMMNRIAHSLMESSGVKVSNETMMEDIDNVLKFGEQLCQALENSTGDVSFTNIDSFVEWWRDNAASFHQQGNIDWKMFLRSLVNMTNRPETADAPLGLTNVSYFKELPKILQSTDERTIVKFIHWNFILQSTALYWLGGESFMHPSTDHRPRSLQCLRPEEPAFAYLFIRKYYGTDRKKAAAELMKNIRKSFELQMTNSNWLSVDAKEAAQEKLRRMEFVLGHEHWYNSETALIDYYKDLKIGDDHFENVLSLMKNKWRALVKLWGKPVIYKQWPWGPLQVGGEYDPQWNIYNVPASTFQSPLFDVSMPDYVGYGTTGYFIGHEIGHGFDSEGIDYGLRPNETLFTDDMIEIFRERAQCFVDVFEGYSEGSGNDTLNENMADWNGLQAALHAYKEVKVRNHPNGELKLPGFLAFTDLQMFFLSFAQSWCNGDGERPDVKYSRHSIRVNGILSNTLAFAEALNCSRKHPLNPAKKCNMWMKEGARP